MVSVRSKGLFFFLIELASAFSRESKLVLYRSPRILIISQPTRTYTKFEYGSAFFK